MNRIIENPELEPIIMPVLAELGLELIRFNLSGTTRSHKMILFVDRIGGVTLRECVDATKNLRLALRQHYGQDRQFLVNVSSPGTDRPLKNRRDFAFIVGKRIVLSYLKEGNPPEEHLLDGELEEALEDAVVVRAEVEGQVFAVPYESIVKARIKLPY